MNDWQADRSILERFETDGFVSLQQFVGREDLSELVFHVDRFIADIVPQMPAAQVFYEEKADRTTLKQIQHMESHDPWFGELFSFGSFRKLAECLLDGPVVPKNMQYFNKPPAIGQPTPPHQDGFYFMLNPCAAVTMWFSLDEVDEQNGCVRYVRGSHRLGMREHARTKTLGFSQGIVDFPTDADRRQEVAIKADPGDLLVHDAMTIHRADGNRCPTRTRRALGFIYYSERARADEQAHAAYQLQLEVDMRSNGKI